LQEALQGWNALDAAARRHRLTTVLSESSMWASGKRDASAGGRLCWTQLCAGRSCRIGTAPARRLLFPGILGLDSHRVCLWGVHHGSSSAPGAAAGTWGTGICRQPRSPRRKPSPAKLEPPRVDCTTEWPGWCSGLPRSADRASAVAPAWLFGLSWRFAGN